ncbi:PREDICTED: protocadherin Fat 4-like, partial [Amphimedon queenslandica]|uniref:Cadherin domain-containing protein n=1 Tax=Amphimedon queenslandica TaxID=400682 RepID=A0AAN0IS28_AMPQE
MVTWDPDRGLDGVPRYYIIGGTGAGYFAIHKTNGSIVTRRELLALTTPTLSLVVMATDSGPHPQFSLFNLTVVITDDHKVFIESPVYNYTISDKYSFTGHTFGYVHVPVHDGRVLSYVIPPAQVILPFAINRSTGGLSVNGTLDRQWYSFRTVASDSTESTVSVINVRVLDTVNNFRPEFPPYFSAILLPASFPLNTSFIRLFVTDGDNDNNADSSYSILAPPNSLIGVVPTSGELFLLTTPSFNSTVITIRANNVDLFSDFNINITLFHANTNTDFDLISNNNDSILVPESVGIGSVIYTLPGSSDGRPLFYYLTNNDDRFTVHSGDVYVTGSMDYEAQQHYTLIFTISDGSNNNNNNKYFTLNVSLTDVNDNPSYFTEDNFVFSLPEDSPLNYVIGSINITDSDSVTASNVIYSIIDWLHPLSPSLFNITSSGALVLTGPLDRETLPSHTLTVAVQDGQFEQLTRVTINVEDIDDNPPSFTGLPLTLVVPEDRSLGDIVTIVTAFDLDDPLNSSSIVYSLSSSHQILDLPLQLESSTGAISINGSLDYESVTSYNLYITAASSTSPSSYSTHSLSILVSNIIDTYPVLYSMEVSVYENQSSSNYVTNIGASPPPPHPVTYSIVNGNDLGHFYIEGYTGTIRTLVPLDRETVDYYNLTVRGSYSNQYYTDISVLISVLDINDNNPSVSVSNLTFLVSEDANVSNQVIFDLNPIDLDQSNNGSIRSILILDSESDTIFDIDTSGHCTLKRQLDREEKETHQFNVLLIDDGHTHPLYSTYLITILVTDINDNDPIFNNYQSTLVVSGPILSNEVLYTFTATDTDGGANGTIRGYFISGGSGEGVFNIDPLTGDLRGLELFEMESNYSLMIGAVDGGGRRSIINISLIISYCRFNGLSFTPPSYSLSVAEDTPPSSLLLSPSITDFNSPGVFRYSLSVHDDQFMINTSTGSLSLLSSPDRELTPVHYLVLIVQDISANMLRVAKAMVTVTISDVNDN